MNLKIKLIDPSLPVPEYKTKGAVAFDLYARKDIEIPSLTPTVIPLNVVVKVPKGYMLGLFSRSSTPKLGLMLGNGVGVIDQDYHGESDELGAMVVNFTQKPVHIEKGQRICQGILIKVAIAEKITTVKNMSKQSRGGFGTTGKR